jgi:serine/threonine protein kinase
MSDNRSCPECGAPLPQDLSLGPCPACILRGALALSSGIAEAAVVEQLGQSIGPYKLIERIGEGGYGVVYRAEQEKPIRRFVALKII